MRKVWIEATLNGAWSRVRQPGIPDTIDAIIAEGIARAPAPPSFTPTPMTAAARDWPVYARIIEGTRAQVDLPVYPSYPSILTTKIQRDGRAGRPYSRRSRRCLAGYDNEQSRTCRRGGEDGARQRR